jgi:acetyltransferase-like isoleucine patch superfamily enzyme
MSVLSKSNISIGDGVYIGRFCNIGLADLGDAVMLADGVAVLSGRQQHGRGTGGGGGGGSTLHSNAQTYSRVKIASGAWIGASAVVMANVGCGEIVGAGAVVVKPVEANTTAVGVPAREIVLANQQNAA